MALLCPMLVKCSTLCLRDRPLPRANSLLYKTPRFQKLTAQAQQQSNSSDDNDAYLMSKEEREAMRRRIRDMLDKTKDPEEETDPEQKKAKMQKLIKDYSLVVEEEDPNWPADADGWGFNFDQFFDKITIKNAKKETDENDENDSDHEEIVWQDDNYIKPIREITAKEWEETVFRDINPLIILLHNRYSRPRENERARVELVRAVNMLWDTGMPSPRCVGVDGVVEEDIVSALKVSVFPEIIFTHAGKILYRDKVVRSAEDWVKIMAYFYYKAVRPPCLPETAGKTREKIPSL